MSQQIPIVTDRMAPEIEQGDLVFVTDEPSTDVGPGDFAQIIYGGGYHHSECEAPLDSPSMFCLCRVVDVVEGDLIIETSINPLHASKQRRIPLECIDAIYPVVEIRKAHTLRAQFTLNQDWPEANLRSGDSVTVDPKVKPSPGDLVRLGRGELALFSKGNADFVTGTVVETHPRMLSFENVIHHAT